MELDMTESRGAAAVGEKPSQKALFSRVMRA